MPRLWRLADALLLFLLLLLPLMIVLGRGEGTADRPTMLFWLLLLLPLLILPWLWRRAEPEEGAGAHVAAAGRSQGEHAASEEFATLVASAVDVRRAYAKAGIPIVEGTLRKQPVRAFEALERLLSPRRMTPLVEDRGHDSVRVIGLPQASGAGFPFEHDRTRARLFGHVTDPHRTFVSGTIGAGTGASPTASTPAPTQAAQNFEIKFMTGMLDHHQMANRDGRDMPPEGDARTAARDVPKRDCRTGRRDRGDAVLAARLVWDQLRAKDDSRRPANVGSALVVERR